MSRRLSALSLGVSLFLVACGGPLEEDETSELKPAKGGTSTTSFSTPRWPGASAENLRAIAL